MMMQLDNFIAGLNRIQQQKIKEGIKAELTAAMILSYWGYPKKEILAMTVGQVCRVSELMVGAARRDPLRVYTELLSDMLSGICCQVRRGKGVNDQFFSHYKSTRGFIKALSYKGWLDFQRTQGLSRQENRYLREMTSRIMNGVM